MLRFAHWAGLGGVICSLGLALLAWFRVPFASHEAPYIALFISVFVSFVPAILGHPARTHSGGETTVDARELRWAEPWTSVLAVAMLSFFFAAFHACALNVASSVSVRKSVVPG